MRLMMPHYISIKFSSSVSREDMGRGNLEVSNNVFELKSNYQTTNQHPLPPNHRHRHTTTAVCCTIYTKRMYT